nr:phage tail protein [Thermoactinomyces sp. AS95]
MNGENYLEFVIPSDHDKAEYLIEENIVLYKDPDGNWNEFVIREIEDEHSDGLFKRVVCDSSSLELNDYVIRDIRPENRDAEYMLNQILQGTRWSVGNVNVPGISTRVFYNKTALECIHELAELFGGELQFRTEFVGNKIIARYVDLVQKRGTNRGKRFVYGKDIKTVKRRVDTSNLATALVGRGRGVENEEGTGYGRKLDFREVEWSVDKGDPVDKPLGQDWVGDEEALQQFGRPSPNGLVHRTRIVEFEDEEDPEVLLQKTWETLQVLKFPAISYELEVIDLESVKGHEHEAVRLGDTVTCIDKKFKPELRLDARIVELEHDLLNPENTKIIMGNVQNAFKDAERNYDTERRQQDRTIPTSWLDGYIDAIQNEIVGGSGTVRHTNDGILLLDKRPDNNPSRAILLNNGIIALSNKEILRMTLQLQQGGTSQKELS